MSSENVNKPNLLEIAKKQREVKLIEKIFRNNSVSELIKMNKTIMIISFYKEQVQALKKIAEDYSDPADQRLRIVSVDAAQGSEADIVILSCVRSNSSRSIGFVDNKNRVCVAISRAKERLIIVASAVSMRAAALSRVILPVSAATIQASIVYPHSVGFE